MRTRLEHNRYARMDLRTPPIKRIFRPNLTDASFPEQAYPGSPHQYVCRHHGYIGICTFSIFTSQRGEIAQGNLRVAYRRLTNTSCCDFLPRFLGNNINSATLLSIAGIWAPATNDIDGKEYEEEGHSLNIGFCGEVNEAN